MNCPDQIEVPVHSKFWLVVRRYDDLVTGGIYADEYPCGVKLFWICADVKDVRIAADAEGIWFPDGFVPLTMKHLLAVADFLHLDTPLPVLPAAAVATPALTPAAAAAGTFVEAH